MMKMDLAVTVPRTVTTLSSVDQHQSHISGASQSPNVDIKQQFKNVYSLVKRFDQQKQSIVSLREIFDSDLELLRSEIVDQSTALIFQTEYEAIGKKSREILWFKGYYDLISVAKRLWKTKQGDKAKLPEDEMSNLIIEGIAHFKSIIVQLERKFQLNLRHHVDFSFLDTYEKNFYTLSTVAQFSGDSDKERRSMEEINKYAMETIHALLISLGDLHRYFIDFNFNMPKISKDFAANYYFEAFKLNPKTGMAHNQLGTLFGGINYGLDSIYHYLYSLVCPVSFDLSDNNVIKLFQSNSKYLEKCDGNNGALADKCDAIGVREFIARFILIVDVMFYDKEISDFNALCHCMILDFRKMLRSKRMDLSSDILFKITAILFFCLVKLKSIGSTKIHHLNAFMVAICAEIVDASTGKLEEFIGECENQNEIFRQRYGKRFNEFEQSVRVARENHKRFVQTRENVIDGDEENRRHEVKSDRDKLSFESNESIDRKVATSANDGGSSGLERGESAKSTSQKNKKKAHLRRRRRRGALSDESDSDLSYFEQSQSDYELDTDFSSDDGDDDSMSTDDDRSEKDEMDNDDNDIVVEEEELVFLNGNDEIVNLNPENVTGKENKNENVENVFDNFVRNLNSLQLNGSASESNHNIESDENQMKINLKKTNEKPKEKAADGEEKCVENPPEKLRYKQKYNKIDPNIVLMFCIQDNSMKALKILFDWLRINGEILTNCFATNPEFIDKIFVLLNNLNIDIFTRKVFFEREFIEGQNVRENLRSLFEMRNTIPLNEDVLLKEFSVLDQCQNSIDWSLPLKLSVTDEEENILRVFKFVDFGFSLCKMKKFKYNFCSRSRRFIQRGESGSNGVANKRSAVKKSRNRGRRKRRNRSPNRVRNRERNRSERRFRSPVALKSTDEHASDEPETKIHSDLKKGYMKSRQITAATKNGDGDNSDAKTSKEKYEIMGKLWLQHEIEELEAKMSKKHTIMTPYLVVDTKALTNHLTSVKNLVKAKKFVVLIAKAVLAELDELKKTSEFARNAIRWLEREFTKGSRFIRLQRVNETKSPSLIKVPKKLDLQTSTLVQIAYLCNFLNENNSPDLLADNIVKQNGSSVVTLLTGDKLIESKCNNFSIIGILNAISVPFEQIDKFYGRYKNK